MSYSILKKFYDGQLSSTAETLIYTVPSSTTNGPSVIRSLMAHNISTSANVNFTMKINDKVFLEETISKQDSLFIGHDWYLVLEPGDTIKVTASTKNVINLIISGSETKV